MIVTYTPEGNAPQRWDFTPRKIRSRDAEQIEQQYGQPFAAFVRDVQAGSFKARRILLWSVMRRDHPGLRPGDTPDFCNDELDVSLSAVEIQELRDRVLAMDAAEVDDEARSRALAALDAQLAAAEEAEGAVVPGKAS